MLNRAAVKRRLQEIADEADKAEAAHKTGRLELKSYRGIVNRLFTESQELKSELKVFDNAQKYAGGTEVAGGGYIEGVANKGMLNPYLQSPVQATADQMQQL